MRFAFTLVRRLPEAVTSNEAKGFLPKGAAE
ncbi:hypothetical protein MESS4_780028 [Mesorhizobium sp. STM 4661]|nr:hypothetical protein MESS4_780028 [Mesorhizobium sp. STM 4661]